LPPFPRRDGLRPAAQLNREGSLRQPEVHPTLADALAEGPGRMRVTPWEHSRFRSPEPQAGKRQRNGGGADCNCEIQRTYRRANRGEWLAAKQDGGTR
jgi:hypothetical protein